MALNVNVNLQSVKVAMKVNNGTKESGEVKTANINLGSINKNAYNAEKAYAITQAIAPCLEKTLNSVVETKVNTLNG